MIIYPWVPVDPRGTGREVTTRGLDPPGRGKIRPGNVGITPGVSFLRNKKT